MKPTLPLALTAFALIGLTACEGEQSQAVAPEGDSGELITIAQVQHGDIACYFILEDETSRPASFELCDDALAGQTVRAESETSSVMSPACEGDPDCALTEEVTLITRVSPVAD